MKNLTFDKVRKPLIDWLTTYIDLLDTNHEDFTRVTDVGKAMYLCAIYHRRLLWGWHRETNATYLNRYLQQMIDYYEAYRFGENGYLIRQTTEWQLLNQHLEFLFVTCGRMIGRTD
jgi:hypothetical protein